jgi:hypothetical protein
VAQPLGAFQPVLPQAELNSIRIALLDSLNDVFVFFDREVKVFNDRTRIQPPVTLRLRLDRSVQSQQPRSGAAMDNQAMKIPVQIEDICLFPAAFAYLEQRSFSFLS